MKEEGISLRELSEAFARVTGDRSAQGSPAASETPAEGSADSFSPTATDEEATNSPPATRHPSPATETAPDIESSADDAADPCRISPLSVLEAMLFVGNRASEPLTAAAVAALVRGVEPGEIPDLVQELNRRYAANRCPYEIVSDGPGYKMAIRGDYAWLRDQFYGRIREARLSRAAIETLAIVAYKQPISAEEVSTQRGTPSGQLLTQLVRRRLLRVERAPRPEGSRPPSVRYCTTDRFLELFGLESLADLPQTDDLEGR